MHVWFISSLQNYHSCMFAVAAKMFKHSKMRSNVCGSSHLPYLSWFSLHILFLGGCVKLFSCHIYDHEWHRLERTQCINLLINVWNKPFFFTSYWFLVHVSVTESVIMYTNSFLNILQDRQPYIQHPDVVLWMLQHACVQTMPTLW